MHVYLVYTIVHSVYRVEVVYKTFPCIMICNDLRCIEKRPTTLQYIFTDPEKGCGVPIHWIVQSLSVCLYVETSSLNIYILLLMPTISK